jgi:hypothetical protein
MSIRLFDVIEEPRGRVLRDLLGALSHHATSATLVLRDDLELSELGRSFLARTALNLVERKRTSSWPGTTLLDEEASVLCFSLRDDVLDEFCRASEGLYGWQQPALPEDLALLRADGTVILGSVAHEHDAFLELSDEEFKMVAAAVPGLLQIVRPHRSGGASDV